MNRKINRGFTLIELLVVVAIISLLSSVVMASLNTARAKARDARRASDVHTMQTALELYASSNNGKYPIKAPWICSDCVGGNYPLSNDPNFFINNFVTPGYISKWPTDPTPVSSRSSADFGYLYASDGNNYTILVYATVESSFSLFPTGGGWGNGTWEICSGPYANCY